MESGRMIEAGESNTHPSSSTGEVGISIPNKKLSSSLSSASNSSTDSSFELIVNVSGQFIGGTSDSLKKNELHNAEYSDSEFVFVNGDDIETRPPMADLSSAAKTSRRSLSRSSSSASESSLHDHVIELPKPENDKDTKAMRPDLNKTLPSPKLGETDNVESRKDLQTCSSTSEPESEHKVKLQQSGNASDNLLSNNPSSPSMAKDNRFIADFNNDDVPSSIAGNVQSQATPTHRIDSSSGSEVATQYPPTQLMERVDDPTSPGYRIPSRVFSRTKSTAPMEWSAASNESLFSIQMGNMSFTREHLCWLGKSGELCRPGESPLNVSQPPNMKHSDCGLKGTQPNGDMAAIEARAAETMREVIRENSENQRKESTTLTESPSQTASLSHQSEGSTKSFQFPILAGDGGKSISLKGGDPVKAKEETKPESTQPASNPQTPKESSSDESPKAVASVGPKRWFSCFSCCPFCS